MVHANIIIRFLSFSLIAFHGVVHAEVTNLGDLDKLQSERFYYEAKAAANKAKREANEEIVMVPGQTGTAGTVSTDPTSSAFDVMPTLVKINGRKAIIAFQDGSTRTVTTGEMLPNGRYQVTNISLNGVSVRRVSDGKKFPIN